jgi:hypothetical protein
LAIAIATWWLLTVGGESEAAVPVETLGAVPQTQRRRRWRLIAVFHQGWTQIIAALLHHEPLPGGGGNPEPWPQLLPPAMTVVAKKPPGQKNLQL